MPDIVKAIKYNSIAHHYNVGVVGPNMYLDNADVHYVNGEDAIMAP